MIAIILRLQNGTEICLAAVQRERCRLLQRYKDKIMLVLGWLTVLFGVFAMLWADGASGSRPWVARSADKGIEFGRSAVIPGRSGASGGRAGETPYFARSDRLEE